MFRLGGGVFRNERPAAVQIGDNAAAPQTTFLEGTGRFVGEPPTGSIRNAQSGDGDVTQGRRYIARQLAAPASAAV